MSWSIRSLAPSALCIALVTATELGARAAPSEPDAEAAPDAPAQAACGKPGQPACPMQAWMRARLGSSLAANNTDALAAALETTARLMPDPSWTSWGTFAKNGANAARNGDMAGARASCKGCHDAYRAQYRERYRLRPVPPG